MLAAAAAAAAKRSPSHRMITKPTTIPCGTSTMGGLFGKPLTLRDLNTALTPIRNDIALLKDNVTSLKDDITFLKDSLLAPDGDQIAKDVTVAVSSTGVASVICHGCLMCRDNDIYLVSAAHAIVDLTYGGTYSIKWSVYQHEDLFTKVTFDRIHIPKEYVLHGSKDVGIARVKGKHFLEHLPNQSKWLQVLLGGGELVGKTVVGHGRVFLRGSVLSYPNENRIMINTPSISGCSGCPLIDGNKNLVAFVHGGVKHRGGRVLHNHNGGTDNVTGYVYADCVADATFFLVDPNFYGILQIAECIADPLASQPTDETAYEEHASPELRQVAPKARTLEESMEALCRKIWSGDIEEGNRITTGPHLELLSHHTHNRE